LIRVSVLAALLALVPLAGPVDVARAETVQGSPAQATPVQPTPRGNLQIPDAARPGPGFDVEAATGAYLDTLPAALRARSDAYFEGGYWLSLWDSLAGVAIAWLLLGTRVSARIREWAERRSRWVFLQAVLYVAVAMVAATLLELPLSFYESYVREHRYGLSNLALGGWFGEQAKGLGLSVVLGAPAVALVHAVVRWRRGDWWLPASLVVVVLIFVQSMIEPVFLAPVFNDYHPLERGPVRDAIERLARANGVPGENLYWFDASRQTTRISANVSGFLGTTRISLNDNLLRDTSLPEIEAVLGHEMGHYVLHHAFKIILEFGLLIAAGFAAAQWAQRRLVDRLGARWAIRDVCDVAGLPLVIALLATWFFLTTPISNSIIRTHEAEADIFGLDAVREPHAFASVSMRLATYRKIAPSPLEELLFFDHPSGLTRVRMCMRWFREHPDAGVGGHADPCPRGGAEGGSG